MVLKMHVRCSFGLSFLLSNNRHLFLLLSDIFFTVVFLFFHVFKVFALMYFSESYFVLVRTFIQADIIFACQVLIVIIKYDTL